ncbi:MAG: DUF3018 family protein [Alphaproteobacteria bacterium]|nr:DUF3018 family protein [Alphaproteobacteria bacterium]
MATAIGRKRHPGKRGRSAKERVGRHRAKLRAQGLKPVQIWVPDTRAPGFAMEIRRQCRLIARGPRDAEDQAFVDSVSWFDSDAAR